MERGFVCYYKIEMHINKIRLTRKFAMRKARARATSEKGGEATNLYFVVVLLQMGPAVVRLVVWAGRGGAYKRMMEPSVITSEIVVGGIRGEQAKKAMACRLFPEVGAELYLPVSLDAQR